MRYTKIITALAHDLILILIILFATTIVWAGEDDKKAGKLQNRFYLGVGAGYGRFDTNFKFTNKETGRSVFVDAEGTLGLDETVGFPLIYASYRFNRRHGISFSYFGVEREATLFQINASRDLNLGDLTITAGADAKVTLTDKSSFYSLIYNYTIFDDNRSFLFLSFGLYGLDLNYAIDARGQITLQGNPVAGGSYSAEASVFAPLPLFGIDAWYFFTKKWALGTKILIIGGSYKDVSALVLDTSVRMKYQFSKHVGFSFGINYFNAGVEIDKPELKTEVDYGFDGVALGFDLRF